MLQYIEKDITTVDYGVIIHGTNNLGVMGSGVALALRNKWPNIFTKYSTICKGAKLDPMSLLGKIDIVPVGSTGTMFVVNCFTQHKYAKDGKKYAVPDAIYKSVSLSLDLARLEQLPLYMPKIGAGLGGLDWKTEVEPIIVELSDTYNKTDIYICTIKENKMDNTTATYYALKVNGKLVSRPVSSVSLLEQQRELLPLDQKHLAEIVSVTQDGKEILFG